MLELYFQRAQQQIIMVFHTYVYKVGLVNNDMSYSTAIGLFNTVVNLVLLIIVNKASDKMSGNSLW